MYTNCHTYYSLRYGTFSEIELLELAQQNHIKQFALTDINSTSACLSIIKNAPNYNIDVSVGVDFRNGTKQQYVVIAKNNVGFQNINTFLTEHVHKKKLMGLLGKTFMKKNSFLKRGALTPRQEDSLHAATRGVTGRRNQRGD